jgi:hypothetical protein
MEGVDQSGIVVSSRGNYWQPEAATVSASGLALGPVVVAWQRDYAPRRVQGDGIMSHERTLSARLRLRPVRCSLFGLVRETRVCHMKHCTPLSPSTPDSDEILYFRPLYGRDRAVRRWFLVAGHGIRSQVTP